MNIRKFVNKIVESYLNENKNIKYNELYNIAKWGLEGEYEHSGCWDDNDLNGAIICAISDFEIFLSEQYPKGLGNIPSHPIIYRLVLLKDINDLNIKKIGKSWFSNPEQIKQQGFFDMLDYLKPKYNSDKNVYMIKGQTYKSNIDMKRTLWERSTQYAENEIVLIDDTNVNVLKIDKLSIKDILNENRFDMRDDDNYKDCFISDIIRMELIENFFNKVKHNKNHNKENPNYFKLIDNWDGYDDQIYIQNKLEDNEFVFWEGWVNSCWDAVYEKPEYKRLSKVDVIEKITKERFPRIANEFGFKIKDYKYFKYRGKFIMKVEFSK